MRKNIFNNIEAYNFSQLKKLNREGGKMLSLIDLINNGTIARNIAGTLIFMMAHGFSFISSAGPDLAGKSTLMIALLNFLKPGLKIHTYTKNNNEIKNKEKKCIVAHEINNRPYYSYIWKDDVKNFFSHGSNSILATTIHANNLGELKNKLFSPPLSIPEENLHSVDLILFTKVKKHLLSKERHLDSIYYNDENKYRLLYKKIRTKV